MVVAKRWREASTYLRVGLFCMVISVILFLIGFSSASWETKTYDDKGTRIFGLWNYVRYYPWGETDRDEIKEEYDKEGLRIISWETPLVITTRDWYHATQAMECLGLICIVLAFLLMMLYFCIPFCKVRVVLCGMICFTFAAVTFIVIGIAIFGTKFADKGFNVGWSMGLAIGSAILAFISGILQVLELMR